MAATAPTPLALPKPAEVAARYVRQSRLRLALIIIPLFLAINSLGLPVFVVQTILSGLHSSGMDPNIPALVVNAVTVFGLELLFIWAWRAGRRERVELSTNLTVVATGLAVMSLLGSQAYLAPGHRTPSTTLVGMIALGVVIVLAGVLGNRVTLVVATVTVNVFSLWLIFLATDTFTDKLPLAINGALTSEWALAVLLFGLQNAYRRALQDLGDSQFAVERARQLDDLKDQFIAMVNHELRNPVMAMMGRLDIIDMSLDQGKTDTMKSHVSQALRAGNGLRDLINSILDTRRQDVGAEDFTPQVVEVRAALDSAIRQLDPREGQMVEREVHVSMSPNFAVWSDGIRLQQILTNLLSNAIKYSPPGSPIAVQAGVVRETVPASGRFQRPQERAMAEVQVRDYGLGVPPEQAPLLFNRFTRLPRDLTSTVVGNGLGLYLCRVLAEAMGGSIWVESTGIEGEGSTFILRLPLPPARVMAHQAPMMERPPITIKA